MIKYLGLISDAINEKDEKALRTFLSIKQDSISKDFINVCGTKEYQKKKLQELCDKYNLKKCQYCYEIVKYFFEWINVFYPECTRMNIKAKNYWNMENISKKLRSPTRFFEENTLACDVEDERKLFRIFDNVFKKWDEQQKIKELYKEADEQTKQKELERKAKNERKLFNISEYPSYEDEKEDKEVKEKKPDFDLNPNDYIIPESGPYNMILGGKETNISDIEERHEYTGPKVCEFMPKTKEELKQILSSNEFTELTSKLNGDVEGEIIKKIGNFIKENKKASKDSINASNLRSIHFYNADELDLDKLQLKKPQYEVIYKKDNKIHSSSILAYQDFFKLENGGIFVSYKLSNDKRLVLYIEGKFESIKRHGKQVGTPKCTQVRYFLCDHYSAESPWYEIIEPIINK